MEYLYKYIIVNFFIIVCNFNTINIDIDINNKINIMTLINLGAYYEH